MATLLLGFDRPRFLLLTLAGGRPLLLECPAEFRVTPDEDDAPMAQRTSTMPPPPPLPTVKARLRVNPNHVWQDDPPPLSERERAPDVQLDPRNLFRRRNAQVAPVGPRLRAAEPAAVEASPDATHDHIIVSGNAGFRASDQGIKAVLTYLRNTQILAAKAQRLDGDDTYIELLPDAFAHLAFTEGIAPTGAPALLEGTLWFGPKAAPLPFADNARLSHFRLELVGCRYGRVSDQFVARLQQILYLRPQALSTAHDPKRLRSKSTRLTANGIPRFDMQETS